jgi:hypothetical protein
MLRIYIERCYSLGFTMSRVPNAVFLGTIAGIIMILLISKAITNPESIKTGLDSKRSGLPISTKFPQSIQQWKGLIGTYAQENNLDADLVAALILQESGGNAHAYSTSGAVGLMQVMPRDGLAAAFFCGETPCFRNRPSTQELYNPDFNVAYGCRFLASLVNRTGNLRDALKSYGPADVGYYYADIVLSLYKKYHQ